MSFSKATQIIISHKEEYRTYIYLASEVTLRFFLNQLKCHCQWNLDKFRGQEEKIIDMVRFHFSSLLPWYSG